MEWDLKLPPWDLPEMEQNACESNLSSVVGSGGGVSGRKAGGLDCSVDLKLGGLGDFGLATKWKEHGRASSVPVLTQSLAPNTTKRPRLPGGGGQQNVSCLVDGCKSDLSNCREYHRRHKVCEAHSKTPVVLVGGQEQRFCQQCSRFHMLGEFDEVKRSCRKRLDGHNRRRRKPQMELSNSINLPNRRGNRFPSYPQLLRTSSLDAKWCDISRITQHPTQASFGSSFYQSFGEGKQFPFLHGGDNFRNGTTVEPAVCQPLLKTMSSAVESSGSKIVISDGLPPVFNSDCALSLLSSSTPKPGISLGNMVAMHRIPIGQPLLSGMQYSTELGYSRGRLAFENVSPTGFSCSGIEDEHVGTVLISDGSEADLHCHSIFHVGSEVPSDGSSQSPLPFTWQ